MSDGRNIGYAAMDQMMGSSLLDNAYVEVARVTLIFGVPYGQADI